MTDILPSQSYFDLCPMGVIVVARDRQKHKILYANTAFLKICGPDIAQALTLADLWPDKHGKELNKILNNPVIPESHMTMFGDQWLKLGLQQADWEGQSAILIWCDNISKIKEVEVGLQKAIEVADQTAEVKSNFLATMSHEMRTPMQSVFGLLELIELENPTPNIAEMVSVAKTSAVGMLEILDDILDLAKIDADKMELDMFEVPVRTLARGVLEALSVKVVGKHIELKDHIDQDVPFVIVGDPKRLRQVLINLTGNAIKFTQQGDVSIRVSRKTQHLPAMNNGINLRFEISDTGIGMNETTQKKLFGNFAQADTSTARKFGGTGLGLSISKKLIELMNGKIGVESVEGKGSTFWFEIPTQEISMASHVIEMPDLRGISVISVEDHPQGAKEIINSLRSMGASVENCETCADALALIRRRPFDVAIVDQGLPDGMGIDLIRQLIEIRPFMGIFMYTVRDDGGLQHSLQSMGVKYLAKPASRLGLGQHVLEAATKATQFEISGPTRLLIAEDTLSVQDLLKRQLKTLNSDADFVMNGKEALDALATGKYGILFSDLHMPEMDGYELIKRIRAQEKNTGRHMPVVVLTADVQMTQRQIYLGHGFDECLLKPVSLGHFKRLLTRWGLLKDTSQSGKKITPQIAFSDALPAIDIRSLIDQMGAFDDSAKEMLGFFIEMTEPVLARLAHGQQNADAKEVLEAAHSIKGAAYSACANVFGDIASELQNHAEKGKINDARIRDLFDEFERVKINIKELQRI